jgi:hypothetical protein
MDSPKRLAPKRRLYRNLLGSCLNLSTRDLLKSPPENKTIVMSKLPGASKEFAAKNYKMSKFPESEVAVSTSNRHGDHAKLEHDRLSANTSYTSSSVKSLLSSVATSNEAKIRVDGANHHDKLDDQTKSPLGPIVCLIPEGGRAALRKRRAELERKTQELGKRRAQLNLHEREKQNLGKRRVEPSQREPEKQAIAGQVMESPLCPIVCLVPEGGRAALRKRRAELERKKQELRKRRAQLNLHEREKQDLGKRRVELSQLEREKQELTGQVLSLKQQLAEHAMALEQQQNVTAASRQREPPMRRLSRNLSESFLEFSARALLKSPLGEKKNVASKRPGGNINAAAPSFESDQMLTLADTEHPMALQQQQNPTAASPIRRLFHDLPARNLLKSPLKKQKNVMSKSPGSIAFAATSTLENDKMSKLPENEVAGSASSQQGDHAKLEDGTLSANTSYTSSSIQSLLSTVATSNEAKIHVDGANHHDEPNSKSKSPLGPIIGLFPERERTELRLRKRMAELERKTQELKKRRVELSQLERERQALAGKVMALKQQLAEHTRPLQQQQNATTASPQRRGVETDQMSNVSEAEQTKGIQQQQNATAASPIRRLFYNISARNILKSPLGKKKNAVSKIAGSKELAAGPSLETDQMPNVSEVEQTEALQQQKNVTAVSPRRQFHNFSARNLLKSPLGEKKNTVSKLLGRKGLALAPSLQTEPMSNGSETEQIVALQQHKNVTAASRQREPPMRRLSRKVSESFLKFSARNRLKSPLGEKKNVASKLPERKAFAAFPYLGTNPMPNDSKSKKTMELRQQQNAIAASPKREAPMQRLHRSLSAMAARYLSKSPLGGKKNAVSKTPGSMTLAAAPILENDQMSKFPGRKVAVSKSIRRLDRAKLERYNSRRKVPSRRGIQRQDAFKVNRGNLEQISSSYEQKKKDASKIPRSIEFDGTKIPRSIEFDGTKIPGTIEFDGIKKTGHNLKLPVPR